MFNPWFESGFWHGYISSGVYIEQFDHFPPPPLFWDHFFPPTNKFAAGGASLWPKKMTFSPVFYVIFDEQVCWRVVQGCKGGRKTPPRKFLEFMTQKDAFLMPFSPFYRGIYCAIRSFSAPPLFWDHFFSPTNKFAAAGVLEDPPAKIFGVFDPKRCIFNAFFPILQGYILCNSIIFWPPPPLLRSFFFPDE